MNTLLKVVGVILIILGVMFTSMGNRFQDGRYWFGLYEKVTDSENKRENRLTFAGVAFLLAGIAVFKFGVIPD